MLREYDVNIDNLMNVIADTYKVFYQEADFQLALGLAIGRLYNDVQVRREECKVLNGDNCYIDLVINKGGYKIPVELKYKTQKSTYVVNNEIIKLKGQSAHGSGRYDFMRDIMRIETYVATHDNCKCGYAILLTNDSQYWEQRDSKANDVEFYTSEGRTVGGILQWHNLTEQFKNYNSKRLNSIHIKNNYILHWKEINTDLEIPFKYLLVKVEK